MRKLLPLAISASLMSLSTLAIGNPAPTDYLVGSWTGSYSLSGSACPSGSTGGTAKLSVTGITKAVQNPDTNADFAGTLQLSNFSAVAEINKMPDYSAPQNITGNTSSGAIYIFESNKNIIFNNSLGGYDYYDSDNPAEWFIQFSNYYTYGSCKIFVGRLTKS